MKAVDIYEQIETQWIEEVGTRESGKVNLELETRSGYSVFIDAVIFESRKMIYAETIDSPAEYQYNVSAHVSDVELYQDGEQITIAKQETDKLIKMLEDGANQEYYDISSY
jgi:hypothetical protein